MKALELDLIAPPKRASSLGVLVLAAAVIAAFMLLTEYRDLEQAVAQIDQERNALERVARGLAATAVGVDTATLQRIESANRIIDQLALPWDRLFGAVESAALDSPAIDAVVLTGIAPDARTGKVQISGDAASENAMIDYVRRLERQPALSGVYLLNHQREPRNGARPFRFTVMATWLPEAAN